MTFLGFAIFFLEVSLITAGGKRTTDNNLPCLKKITNFKTLTKSLTDSIPFVSFHPLFRGKELFVFCSKCPLLLCGFRLTPV